MIKTILLPFLLLLLYLGANIYVPFRLVKLFAINRPKVLYIIFAVTTVSFPLAMKLQRSIANSMTGIYYLLATTWLGFFLYLLILLILLEFISLFVRPPKKIAGVTIIFMAGLVSLYALWNANSFQVDQVTIPIHGLEKELRFIFISDLHIDDFRGKDYLEKIVDATNKEVPDLVFISGDMIDSKNLLTGDTFAIVKKIKAPVYFTMGNHENYANREKTLEMLVQQGVRVLHNEVVETNDIVLIGLDYMKADPHVFEMHPPKNKLTIEEVLPTLSIPAGKPTILMHHSPVGIEYVHKRGLNLMLAGHTHAGQIFPFNWIIRLFYRYPRGLYNYRGTYIYVTQGAGTFGPRMRLGTHNEITLIRLVKHPPLTSQ